MSKPILDVIIKTIDKKKKKITALFDAGSFYTIVRADSLPSSSRAVFYYKKSEKLGTAQKQGKVTIIGETSLIITIGEKMIKTHALISKDLSREMIIGTETMQVWDITIKNHRGKPQIIVGHDMRDPDITEVA